MREASPAASDFISYKVDLQQAELKLYWKDEHNQRFKSLQNLKEQLETQGQKLVFAMNGGMFKADYSPQGLFIQRGIKITSLDTAAGDGNFYLRPNGVFYTTINKKAYVCRTQDFVGAKDVAYATQSGPLLVIDGKIHPAFKQGSTNLHIRNGVGILPDNRIILAMSKSKISLFDFATYFKQAGCKNALYLDGFVSRTYLPSEGWLQTDGDFGVIIGITTAKP
ncbi:phosphodiester glycosidase family protein [Hymenobacter arizonensis]|uniref:Uncharacterized protein YigE, DUF2233 family n=1 Tax=Hymenobacter arizonensis TaxID=1227077 RepID=A0A1I5SH22_HYMAR|nr:phosphodiester glycosidase family protein [Hymenobacter arizonensis]SFP70050.1 Uncharacterized protein YigE, DUF2233 family [Hymenobacter arizonensis]